MSVTPIRPPGRRTRAISRKTAALSAARLITQLLITTSTDVGRQRDGLDVALAGTRRSSRPPRRRSAAPGPASRRSCRGRTRARSARRASRRAGRRCPPPDPRSSTRSPSRSSATAVGLPQPSEASTAASGSSACSSAEYSPATDLGRVSAATGPTLRDRGRRGVVLSDVLVDRLGRHRAPASSGRRGRSTH